MNTSPKRLKRETKRGIYPILLVMVNGSRGFESGGVGA